MLTAEAALADWYGEFELPEGAVAEWRIGPARFQVVHRFGEWRVSQQRDEGLPLHAEVAFDDVEPMPEDKVERFVYADQSGVFHVQPLLPDRSVVSRPAAPLFVPAGEAVRLYVTVPLWLQLSVGKQRKRLLEVPSYRPSDTWFGPTTMTGELCYALRSRCRLYLEDAEFVPYRAHIPVQIRNQASKQLSLERVCVPVRQLSLYVTRDGRFWTDEVGLEQRDEGGSLAALRLGGKAPKEAVDAQRIATSRDAPGRRTAIHAFSALFNL
ncbi:hypothetical protein [Alkalilimnicola ehrlichii]|uniref:hypothetical protein n=1 Tax=Alkalilimnicola ehrlichii TaxID=351052 RepID=UPI001C6EC040|nr:hypothetical protein [Alkalilimnicola ehrlichii]